MLAVAILAAGKGTRMRSSLPKVLQQIAGSSLIERVLKSSNELNPDRRLVIVGHQVELLKEKLNHHKGLEYVMQKPQNGTGHAVQQLLPILKGFNGELLVLNGDVPLLKPQTIKSLIKRHQSYGCGVTFLTARINNPKGYGRVFADEQGRVKEIIEERDCNEDQKLNTLTNAGIYCFNWEQLAKILPKLSDNNDQKEIYLTDTISLLPEAMHLEVDDTEEVSGVNNRIQMAKCEAIIQKQLCEEWMLKGVSFIDKGSCTLSENCEFGRDVIIEPQTHLRGNCKIGDNCKIGPGTLIENSVLGDNVKVINSIIRESKVANNVDIGPFANIRPETTLEDNCKIGNFVEIKKSTIGKESKVNHLSYIGDSTLGRKVNIGAGTITANFDGTNKHQTLIDDYSKIGANSVLIAPIKLGKNVTIGAGSTITKDVPNNSLGLGRAKQLIKREWSN